MKKTAIRIGKALLIAVYILWNLLFVFVGTVLGIKSRQDIETSKSFFGFYIQRTCGYSMYPAVKPDSLALEKEININDVQVGDIIVFKSDQYNNQYKFIMHRVTEIQNVDGETYITTKGDGNQYEDYEYVTKDNLYCRIIYASTGLYKFINAFSGIDGWIILSFPAVATLVYYFIKIIRLLRELQTQV